MKVGIRIVVFAMIALKISMTANGQSFPLLSVTSSNTFAVNEHKTITNATPPVIESSNNIRLIKFEDVPITVAMENLARQAGINYMLDPQIGYSQPDQYGQIRPEPVVSMTWKNISAEQGFVALCKAYNFTVIRDTNADVVLIRHKGHDVNFVDSNFCANDTNRIPVIEFQSVPMADALKALAKQARLKCIFGARLGSDESVLSIRWENITATQAFAAVCENYDLNVYRFPDSNDVDVEPPD